MASLFYKMLFWAMIGCLPFAFVYNTELFGRLNCPKNGGPLDMFFLTMTSLADGLWVVMLVTFIQSLHKTSRHFGTFILAMLIGNIVLQSAKYLFDAPRPVAALGEVVCVLGQKLTSRSFPSGHSFSAILLFMHIRPHKSLPLAAAFALLAVLAVLSRAYVGAHFPRDMMVGGLIAVVAYLAAEFFMLKIRPWRMRGNAQKLLIAIPGLGTPLIYIFAYHEKTRELEFFLTPLAWAMVAYWVGFTAYRVYVFVRQPALPDDTKSSRA